MKISGINLNLFRARTTETTTQTQQNPFITGSTNPFAGGLSKDVFQNSSIENKQPNIFAQKAAEFVTTWNKSIENIKTGTKEFFAPAISFAGQIKTGFNKLNEIKVEDLFAGLKNEISMLTLDKDVRKYAKMSTADLRSELSKELAA